MAWGSKKDPVPSRTWWRGAPPVPVTTVPTLPVGGSEAQSWETLGRTQQVGCGQPQRKQVTAAGESTCTPQRGFKSLALGVGSLGCVPSAGTCRLRARGQSLGLQSGIPPLWRDSRSSCVQMGRGTKRRAPCVRPRCVLSTQTVLTRLWNYASSRLSGLGRGEWRRTPKLLRTQAPLQDVSLDSTVPPEAPQSGFLLPTPATQTRSCSAFFYKQLTFFFWQAFAVQRGCWSPAFTSCLPSFLHTGLPGRLTSKSSFLSRLLQPDEQSRWSPPCWPLSPDLP